MSNDPTDETAAYRAAWDKWEAAVKSGANPAETRALWREVNAAVDNLHAAQGRLLDAITAPAPDGAARLSHADVPGLTPETCPERESHGTPFRYCPVKGCGWHERMPR